MSNSESEKRGQSLWTVIRSVMSSMIGVQNSEQHQEDFKKGKVSTYILAGVIATTLFVLAVLGVVKLVMSIATP